jgi:glycosyltransferase involved in cell wall biosynthesis
MRVTVIGPSKRFLSGVSYYTIRLSNALSEIMDVKTILFRNMLPKRLFPGWRRVGKELTNLEFDERVKVYEILDWYNPLSWFKAYRIARKSDSLILQWWTSSVAHMYLSIELLNKISGKIPVIIEFHEVVDPMENSILPIKIYSRVMGRLIRKLASHYVVHSEVDKKLVSKTYGIPEQKITIIPHGIYDHYEKIENAREILGINEDFVILFFGLLRPYKGVQDLIKAFERLPNEIRNNSRLLIVGETWEDKESVKAVEKSPFKDKITIVNKYVPDSEVSIYFSAADVLVLPYTRASQSGVAHIGMSYGLPIIATKVGGLLESLSKYEGTFFAEPSNAESIAKSVAEVYRKKGKLYSPPEGLKWENITRKWRALLEELLR